MVFMEWKVSDNSSDGNVFWEEVEFVDVSIFCIIIIGICVVGIVRGFCRGGELFYEGVVSGGFLCIGEIECEVVDIVSVYVKSFFYVGWV